MSMHIQPISYYLPHERIKTFLIKDTEMTSPSNLTESNAVFTCLENLPKNDVTAQVTIGEC